jgi:hypothetical protein
MKRSELRSHRVMKVRLINSRYASLPSQFGCKGPAEDKDLLKEIRRSILRKLSKRLDEDRYFCE